MRRLYYRDEQWLIYTRDAEGMTRELLLEATRCHDERMVSQGVEHLHGWGDDAVEWYGWTKDSAIAVGFPVDLQETDMTTDEASVPATSMDA